MSRTTKAAKKPVAKTGPATTPATLHGIGLIHHPTKGVMIRLKDIKFAPRPKPGEELTLGFFNPRPEEEVNDPAKSAKLRYNLRIEGLIEPPAIRLWTDPTDRTRVIDNAHIAGERRLRRMNEIFDQKLLCADYQTPKPAAFKTGAMVCAQSRFGKVVKQTGTTVVIECDDHHGKGEITADYSLVLPTTTGDKAFEWVAVQLYCDIADERAMRIAFSENDQSEALSVKAEIMLVERYLAMKDASGKKAKYNQQQIAHILDTNITFVSQRASFRKELPPAAFEKVMNGEMAANVAVNILSRPKEKRAAYFAAMLADEQKTTEQIIRRHQLEQEQHEDEADLHRDEARAAAASGDAEAAAREERRAAAADKKAQLAKDRKERAQADSGKIKAGHASRAQTTTGIVPKRGGTMLTRDQIEEVFVRGMSKFAVDGGVDPICGQPIPTDYASIVRRTARAILNGVMDPHAVIREYQIENDVWTLPGQTAAGRVEPATAPPKRGGKSRLPDEDEEDVVEDDLDEEEGDEDEDEDEDEEGDEDELDEEAVGADHDDYDAREELRSMGHYDPRDGRMWD